MTYHASKESLDSVMTLTEGTKMPMILLHESFNVVNLPNEQIKLVPFLASKFKVAFITIIAFVVQCNCLLAIVTWGAFFLLSTSLCSTA